MAKIGRPRATECPKGHPYTPENTYLYTRRDGYTTQACRQCRALSVKARNEELKERRKSEPRKPRKNAAKPPICGHPDRPMEGHGLCSMCLQRHKYRALSPEQKQKRYAAVRRWIENNPVKVRHMRVRYYYGIDPEQYDALWSEQRGLCAICLSDTAIHLDHCHETGRIRGLLCQSCNFGLGNFKDNKARLRAAIEYLSKWCNDHGAYDDRAVQVIANTGQIVMEATSD